MVIVGLQGGLGNQLFQYATGRALSAAWGSKLVLDLKWFDDVVDMKEVTVREYALAPFALPVMTQNIGQPDASRGRISRLMARLRTPFLPASQRPFRLVKESSFQYSPKIFGTPSPVWLDGYWQSWRYFEAIESQLRAELTTPRAMNPASWAMLNRIQSSPIPVCLHVRRGDYVSNPSAAHFHGTCSVNYYHEAIAELSRTGSPICFIFSDDPDWVRNNLELPCEAVIVDINGSADAHLDLWLMASCRHFVIANSSLSWWAAWLGSSPDKQVFTPKHWFQGYQYNVSDLIPPNWRRI